MLCTDAMIVELTYIRSSDADSVGRTAARLGERLRNGVEVAPGFVVTADDLSELVEREHLAEQIQGTSAEEAAATAARIIEAAELPADLVDDLAESYAALGRDAWVSVQPSPVVRDLGVSRELLGPTQGADAVWALVRQVWASLWAPEAVARRAEKGVESPQDKLAVLVQQAEAPAEPETAEPATSTAEATATSTTVDPGADAPSAVETEQMLPFVEEAEESTTDTTNPASAETTTTETETAAEAPEVEDASVLESGTAEPAPEAGTTEPTPEATAAETMAPVAETPNANATADAAPEQSPELVTSDTAQQKAAAEDTDKTGPTADGTDSGAFTKNEPATDEPDSAGAETGAAEAEPATDSPEAADQGAKDAADDREEQRGEQSTASTENTWGGQNQAWQGSRPDSGSASSPRDGGTDGGSSAGRWALIGLVSCVLFFIIRRLRRH